MKESGNTLSKVIGRTDIIAIGFGTMVGWSWIVMAASWVNEAGWLGALTAFAIGGLIILSIGITYGELTAALPLAGGEFVFAYRSMGKNAAWIVGWIMALAYLGVAAWEGIALATAIDFVFPIPDAVPLWEIAGHQVYLSWALMGSFGAVVIMFLNIFGIRPAILFQVMATAALMIIVLIIFFGGIVFGSKENIGETFVDGEGFSYVFLMVPAMLIGFDVIPQSAEEMNIGSRNIGKMVLVCIIASMIWYFLLIIGISLAAPLEIRASGKLPVADIAAYMFHGEIFSTVVIIGGIFGILTSWNGFFIGATRLIFSMGRARLLPEIFGKVHKKYKSPWAASLLVGSICVFSPFLGMNALQWFVDTSSMCALFSYIFVVISFLILKKKEPDLARPLDIKGGLKVGIIILIVSCLYFILYLQEGLFAISLGPEFVITISWLLVGVLLILLARKTNKELSWEQQELLIFGERFARKGARYEK